MNINKKKVAFHTLGCKLNFAETSALSRSLPDEYFEKTASNFDADIHVINTCSVTGTADKKCRQLIKHIIKQNPDSIIIVTGCYAQLRPEEAAAIPGVDLVLGTNEKFSLASYISPEIQKHNPEIHSGILTPEDKFFHAFSAGDRTRSFLKIQDGCDYKCSYCTIPKARGTSRNPSINSLIEEVKEIAARQIREIVLTGVNIGDFGKSTGDNLEQLLHKLTDIEGIMRYRISSVEPNLLTEEIIRFVADNDKMMPHFHIPLQNGSNKILRLMRRRYKREVFADKVLHIKDMIPLAGIGADIITGFPGETDEDFEETYEFIKSLPLTYLHVFPYSERPGTDAVLLPGKVSNKTKEIRSKALIALSMQKHLDFMKLNEGHEDEVLFEALNDNGRISGFSRNYIRAETTWNPDLTGKIVKVRLMGIADTGRMNVEILK